MAAHSSILAWRIPRTEEPGRLWSIASQSRARLKQLSTHVRVHTYIHIYTSILFHILFHYWLSRDIDYSSLCSTVEPCCQRVFLKREKVSVGLWKADKLIPRVTEGWVWTHVQGSRQGSWESVCIAAMWSGSQPLCLPASRVTCWEPEVDTLLFTKGLEWESPQLGDIIWLYSHQEVLPQA